jgi:hypothetical protein
MLFNAHHEPIEFNLASRIRIDVDPVVRHDHGNGNGNASSDDVLKSSSP